MKVSSLGYFTGPQLSDIDRKDEIESAELSSSGDSPIEETKADAETSDEQQTQDGVLRLMEFIARRREKQKRQNSVAQNPTEKALAAYERQTSGNIQFRGRNLNRRF